MKAKNFSGLAPALVIVAELDVLRDEGKAYVKKLNEAGSKAELTEYKGVPHTFMMYDKILKASQEYNRDSVKALQEAFQEH